MAKETLKATLVGVADGALVGAWQGVLYTGTSAGWSIPIMGGIGGVVGGVTAFTAEKLGRSKNVTVEVKNPVTQAPEHVEVPWITQWDVKLEDIANQKAAMAEPEMA